MCQHGVNGTLQHIPCVLPPLMTHIHMPPSPLLLTLPRMRTDANVSLHSPIPPTYSVPTPTDPPHPLLFSVDTQAPYLGSGPLRLHQDFGKEIWVAHLGEKGQEMLGVASRALACWHVNTWTSFFHSSICVHRYQQQLSFKICSFHTLFLSFTNKPIFYTMFLTSPVLSFLFFLYLYLIPTSPSVAPLLPPSSNPSSTLLPPFLHAPCLGLWKGLRRSKPKIATSWGAMMPMRSPGKGRRKMLMGGKKLFVLRASKKCLTTVEPIWPSRDCNSQQKLIFGKAIAWKYIARSEFWYTNLYSS